METRLIDPGVFILLYDVSIKNLEMPCFRQVEMKGGAACQTRATIVLSNGLPRSAPPATFMPSIGCLGYLPVIGPRSFFATAAHVHSRLPYYGRIFLLHHQGFDHGHACFCMRCNTANGKHSKASMPLLTWMVSHQYQLYNSCATVFAACRNMRCNIIFGESKGEVTRDITVSLELSWWHGIVRKNSTV